MLSFCPTLSKMHDNPWSAPTRLLVSFVRHLPYPPCAPSRTQADRQRGSASRIGLHAKRVADADT
jgi:hypothetical protein